MSSRPTLPATENYIERRYSTTGAQVQLRAAAQGESPRLAGYAIVYNSRSQDLGGFVEVIAPAAFDDANFTAIPQPDVALLCDHDVSKVLARASNGSLIIDDDKHGLSFEAWPSDTSFARDLFVNTRVGNIRSMSFAFSIVDDGEEWTQERGGVYLRTVTKARLHEISTVLFPAYTDSSVGLRHLEAFKSVTPTMQVQRYLDRANACNARGDAYGWAKAENKARELLGRIRAEMD